MAEPHIRLILTLTCELCDLKAIWELVNSGGQVVGYYCPRHGKLALEEYLEAGT